MIDKVREIKKQHEKKWLSIKGVVAIGIGNVSVNRIGLIISVIKDVKKIRNRIPKEIDGIPIQIQETGDLKAL